MNFMNSKNPISIARSKQIDDQVVIMIVKGYFNKLIFRKSLATNMD